MKNSPAFTDESAFSPASILTRNNVRVFGSGSRTMIFAHGLGCDQHMWRHITPAFEADYRIVLFDHVGSGHSDLTAYDPTKHASLEGYATDLLEICAALEISDAIFVGHSVSAMIGVLAELREPWRFHRMIHIGPSPRYIDDEGYRGGFSRGEIEEMLEFLDSNYFGWVAAMTPAIMANGERPELAEELGNSFCRTDPEIARRFARVTFLSDNRRDLARVSTPSLVLQCRADIVAPLAVGEYLRTHLPECRLVIMEATGHCPHLSAPDETIGAMQA